MKDIPTRKITAVLRGAGATKAIGRTARAVLRRKDLPVNILHCIGKELESKGIITRKQFLESCKS